MRVWSVTGDEEAKDGEELLIDPAEELQPILLKRDSGLGAEK